MDPQAALDAAESAINDGDKAEAREYLANYASWRRNGGFQPAGGDARHASLLKRLRSRKRVSKNSRKARLRHNVEERASSPNLIMWGAILVGGFLAWRWLSERNKTAPASLVTSPGKSGTIGTDAGWAAYQQRPMAPRDTFALNRAQHDEFWGTLTDTEKQKALQLYAMPESQIMAAAQDPANASVVGKGMAFTLRVMAQQQAPQGGRTPPNSTQVPPETGTKGIGNYFNDGD